jgi:hypothetical protein
MEVTELDLGPGRSSYAFAPAAQATPAEDEESALGGRIPINTDGGCMANGEPVAASGLRQVFESTLQLRGNAATTRLPGHRRAHSCTSVKFAGGIGDVNDLWTDAERGRRSDYGAPVAPPSFVIGCFSGIQFGWPGLGSFRSATDMDLIAPVYWGDTISATCRYDGFTGPRPSSFAGA